MSKLHPYTMKSPPLLLSLLAILTPICALAQRAEPSIESLDKARALVAAVAAASQVGT
jgi:hypothetical protein